MTQHTLILTIGRNIGDTPMPGPRWVAFKGAVHYELLRAQAYHILQRPSLVNEGDDQIGEWAGQREGAATFVAFINVASIDQLRWRLQKVKREYEQDAIGFIHVETKEGHLI